RQHVDFIDDVNLEARPGRTVLNVLAEIPNLVDAAVAGAVDFQNVDILAGGDTPTNLALIAGRWRRAVYAIQRLGENPSGARLADSARPGEKIGVGNSIALQCIGQSLSDVFLTDNVLELLRAIAPGQDGIYFRTGALEGFFTARSRLPLGHGRS